MKECELCDLGARMYCESDEASLCWDCDAKVHSANFLVARHSRSLLCQICQSVTAWRASGAKPSPTVSVCEKCVVRNRCKNGKEEDEEEDENQVVPLASAVSGPPASSCSTQEESSEQHSGESQVGNDSNPNPDSSLKRLHESGDLRSEGDLGCSCSCSGLNNSNWASLKTAFEDDATSLGSRVLSHRSKKRKEVGDQNSLLVETLERIQREENLGSSNSTVLAICRICNDSRAMELASVDSPETPSCV